MTIRILVASWSLVLVGCQCNPGDDKGDDTLGRDSAEATDPPDSFGPTVDDTGSAPVRSVSLFVITDFRAHLETFPTTIRTAPGTADLQLRGGAARIQRTIEDLVVDAPQHVRLLLGDATYGSVEAAYSAGESIVPVLESMSLDAFVPGPLDLAFGADVTWARYRAPDRPQLFSPFTLDITPFDPPLLAANLRIDDNHTGDLSPGDAASIRQDLGPVDGQVFGIPTQRHAFDDRVVCLIGLVGSQIGHGVPRQTMTFEVPDPTGNPALVGTLASNLRQQDCDAVVVASTQGVQADLALADALDPGAVDAIVSATSGERIDEPLVSASGAWVVSARDSAFVGELRFGFGSDGTLQAASWHLHDVTDDLDPEEQVEAAVSAVRDRYVGSFVFVEAEFDRLYHVDRPDLRRSADALIGPIPRDLTGRDALQGSLQATLAATLLEEVPDAPSIGPTQVAIVDLGRHPQHLVGAGTILPDGTVATGQIRVEALYRIDPDERTVVAGEIGWDELIAALEDQIGATLDDTTWMPGLAGIGGSIDLTAAPGQRIADVILDGSDTDDPLVVVVVGLRRAGDPHGTISGIEGFTNLVDILDGPTPLRFRTAIERRLTDLPDPPAPWTDLSATPRWPDAPWIVPLP